MKTIADLRKGFPRAGRLEWIGLSSKPRGEIVEVQEATLETGRGLVDDHHAKGRPSARQVTLIQWEHLSVIAALLGADRILPATLRRNLVVAGIPLLALKDRSFRIGETLLEGTGPCEPCSRMEGALGLGGYNAMRGHGGITARVLVGGAIRIGDPVEFVDTLDIAAT